jgi:hypothetical protein
VGESAIEQPVPRAKIRQRWLLWAAVAVVGVIFLFPPFTPLAPWRSVTDAVPWRMTRWVPWAYPTRSTETTAGSCGTAQVDPPPDGPAEFKVEVFGYTWTAVLMDPSRETGGDRSRGYYMEGQFHLVDRTHGVFIQNGGVRHVTFARGHPGKTFCSV